MEELQELRRIIDDIDRKMMEFEQRMDCVCEVAAVKKKYQMPVLQEGREQAVIDACCGYLNNKGYEDAAVKFIKYVMQLSREEQNNCM